MHTLIIIAVFSVIVFAPVVAAQISRSYKRKHDSSAGIPAVKITDPVPPKVVHHLRPKPRRRKF